MEWFKKQSGLVKFGLVVAVLALLIFMASFGID